jgi:DNA-binding transcriptional MerR regulator
MQLMTISEVARELGISVDWLRRAEKVGTIPRARRWVSGWRVYSTEEVERLRGILIPSVASHRGTGDGQN